ncbi:MAG: hypothetical protein P8H97_05185 [Pseudomonadales bacterium]|nr:hypothetical protein [Pseudomonadales bacterium]
MHPIKQVRHSQVKRTFINFAEWPGSVEGLLQFKEEAVKQVVERSYSVAEVAERLGIWGGEHGDACDLGIDGDLMRNTVEIAAGL